MSKRHNIAYVKPTEPTFIRQLKEQIGYKEGPTVDTKREDIGHVDEDDLQDTEEEQPQVVVLNSGDLNAEEVAQEKLRLEREEQTTPADLNVPIVFKKPTKKTSTASEGTSDSSRDRKCTKRKDESTEKKNKKHRNYSLLSFDDEEGT